jgi:sensor histidine kinase YesM
MKKKYRELNHPSLRIIQHLAFWVLSFFVFLHLFKSGARAEKVDYIYTGLFQLTVLPAVYINLEILLPRPGNVRRWILYIPFILTLIAFFSWINYSFFDRWSVSVLPDYFFISYFTWGEVVLFFSVYIIITSLLKLSKSWFVVSELRKELLEKEKQKTEVELKALKAQINPHFFFNTLNNIYSMALDKDERLPATILQLSELMRYFLYESGDNFVPLEKELAVLNNYIALQKIRTGKTTDIDFRCAGDISGQSIAPLLLATFLENAFKHSGGAEKDFVSAEIRIEKNKLNFTVENSKGKADTVKEKENRGLGLENIRRQLELLYPGKYFLEIKNLPDRFFVQLQLDL